MKKEIKAFGITFEVSEDYFTTLSEISRKCDIPRRKIALMFRKMEIEPVLKKKNGRVLRGYQVRLKNIPSKEGKTKESQEIDTPFECEFDADTISAINAIREQYRDEDQPINLDWDGWKQSFLFRISVPCLRAENFGYAYSYGFYYNPQTDCFEFYGTPEQWDELEGKYR